MVTIKDIAKAAGVSYATVSRALNDVTGTKESTATRIKELALKMGYKKNTLAAGLVTNRTNTIGFVVPDIGNPFFVKILNSVSRIAGEYGFNVLICNTDWNEDKEEQNLHILVERRVDALILYPSSPDSLKSESLNKLTIPVVILGNPVEEINKKYSSIIVDNFLAGYMAAEHIIKCGYKKVAFLGGTKKSRSSEKRLIGIRDCFKHCDRQLNEEMISEDSYSVESGYRRAKEFLYWPKDKRPDVFICGNDLIALGVHSAVADLAMTVGEDIGIIGYDDVFYAALPQVQLTSVKIPCTKMGKLAMKIIAKELSPNIEINFKNENDKGLYVLEPKLIVRRSTRNKS